MNSSQQANQPNLLLIWVYYTLAAVALGVTWTFNVQYFLQGGGIAPHVFFGAAFANALTTAITLDVYLAALVFSIWVWVDAKRLGIGKAWLYIVLCFGIGLAVAWPLYLARREKGVLHG